MGAAAASAVAVGATVIGTGVSAYGAIQQGQAQKAAADYQAQVAQNNATVAGYNATAAQNQAAAKAQATQRAGDIRLSAQRAALGANGGTLDSGSALDVQTTTAGETQQGVNADQYQGQLAAYSYRVQGSNDNAQAGLDTIAGQNAQTASYTNAASSLLGGASQVSAKWQMYKQQVGPAPNPYDGPNASNPFDGPGY